MNVLISGQFDINKLINLNFDLKKCIIYVVGNNEVIPYCRSNNIDYVQEEPNWEEGIGAAYSATNLLLDNKPDLVIIFDNGEKYSRSIREKSLEMELNTLILY